MMRRNNSFNEHKYAFDITIVSDNNALNFAIKHHGELFSNTPVVFCGINVQGQVLFLASLPKPRYKSHEKTDYRIKYSQI
jgi:hypothetical protein